MKYTVTLMGIPWDGSDTIRLLVHTSGNPDWMTTEVWYEELLGRKKAWCCKCYSINAAMSGSCAHAKAVKRFMRRING